MRDRFEAWKRCAPVALDLRRNSGSGQFKNPVLEREFRAYAQGARDHVMPVVASDSIVEAMVAAGCRRDWAQDVYQAIRQEVYRD